MKKFIFSLMLIVTITSQSFAQDKKGYLGFSLGPSFPTGDLASKDIDNDAAGWAKPGILFDISFASKLNNSNFGITAMLRGQATPTDAQAIADEMANLAPGPKWTVESGSWSIGSLMVGGFCSLPVSDKVTFDPRAMIGLVNASAPELTITGTGSGGGSAWFKQGSTSAVSFGYLIGGGFKFDIGNSVYLLTNIDYLGSKPEFKNVEYTASDGSKVNDTWSQKMGTLNMSLGIALKL